MLLLIDASFGFEMQTFEFLNILQLHGFPKIMGVLTHLDAFKDSKRLRNTKKQLKQRFWTEIYQGAKLFYLPGLINGKYPKTEVHNLSLYISRMKFRPLVWRNTHPYVLVDRYEDITDPAIVSENPAADRTLSMYGYLRGTNLKSDMKVHIVGCGDYFMNNVTLMPDPAPLPESDPEKKKVRRSLKDKEVVLYAPFSNVGNVLYDSDAMYIQMRELHFSKNSGEGNVENAESSVREVNSEGVRLVKSLQGLETGLDHALDRSTLTLFKGGKEVSSKDVVEEEEESDYYDDDGEDEEEHESDLDDENDQDLSDADSSGSETDDEEEATLKSGGSKHPKSVSVVTDDGRVRRRAVFDNVDVEEGSSSEDEEASNEDGDDVDMEDGEEEEEEEEDDDNDNLADASAAKWKSNLSSKATENYFSNASTVTLQTLVYGSTGNAHNGNNVVDSDDEEEEGDDDDNFFKVRKQGSDKGVSNGRGGTIAKSAFAGGVEIDDDMMDTSRFRPDLTDLIVSSI